MDVLLESTLRSAADRFESIRLALYHREDRKIFVEAMRRFVSNPAVRAALDGQRRAGPSPRLIEHLWMVEISRPYSWRVSHYSPQDQLVGVSGGDPSEYWQWKPRAHRAYVHQQSYPDDDWKDRRFLGWLPPAVAEFLDPSFLLRRVEGSRSQLTLDVVSGSVVSGRAAHEVRGSIFDWDSRVPWSETIRVGSAYRIDVDQSLGILLRVGSCLDDVEFSTYQIFDIELGVTFSQNHFGLHVPPGTTVSAPNA